MIAAALVLLATGAAPARPNVLFCFADDWGRVAGAYAALDKRPSPNSVVKTPHIDRIAREGTLFRHSFVDAPSCTPCRSALLSGRHFFACGRGAILQTARWDPAIPSFPLLLKDAGVAIGETYKVWSPGTPVDAPFGAGKYAFEKAGNRCNNYSETATRMLSNGRSLAEARAAMHGEVRANFKAFRAGVEVGRPWFYWFGPTTVHRTWIKGSGKALWGIEPDSLKGKLPGFLPDVPEVREDFADYLGEIQAFDSYVGVLLEELQRRGELETTIVVVSGDHGPPGFTHGKCNLYDFGTAVSLAVRRPGGTPGRVVDDFVNLADLAPTFLELGGASLPPGMHGRSLVKILKAKESGLVDPSRSFVIAGRERHVAAAREGNLPYPQRTIRTKDFRYVRNYAPDRWPLGSPWKGEEPPAPEELVKNTLAAFADMDAGPTKAWLVANRVTAAGKSHYERAFGKRPAEELFDIATDPEQLFNVAADSKYAKAKAEVAKKLADELARCGDPRLAESDVPFERPPFTDAK